MIELGQKSIIRKVQKYSRDLWKSKFYIIIVYNYSDQGDYEIAMTGNALEHLVRLRNDETK